MIRISHDCLYVMFYMGFIHFSSSTMYDNKGNSILFFYSKIKYAHYIYSIVL